MAFGRSGRGSDGAAASGSVGTWGQGKTVAIDFVESDAAEPARPSVSEFTIAKATDAAPPAKPGLQEHTISKWLDSTMAFAGGSGPSASHYAHETTDAASAAEGSGAGGVWRTTNFLTDAAGEVAGSESGGMTKAPGADRKFLDLMSFGGGGDPETSIDQGVTVLAWARVDDTPPLAGAHATGTLLAPSDPALDLGTVVEGTNGNDILFQSGDWWETLLGLGGDDVFVAVTSKVTPATDTWDGGSGVNTAYFGSVDTPVRVNLATGTAWRDQGDGGSVGGITLINIQDVVGSAHDDTLTGDAGPNTLWGHDGNDLLIGGAGDDTLDGGQGNDVLRGGAGVDVIRGGLGADEIRWHVGDLGRDEIEGFVLGEDRIAFGDGFLVTADPANSLFVVGSFGEGVLMADTIEAGWQEIAIFRGISDDALRAAINNGVLFGYEAGPLADGAPGGFVGPARPDLGRGGGDLAIRQESYGPDPAPQHAGGVNVLMGDGGVRLLRESMDVGTWSAGLTDPPDAFAMLSHIDDTGML